ncbi:YoaP domain-containing protein [Acidobacteriota bacterium]
MSDKIKVISTNLDNLSEYPPRCFLNPKNEGYLIKLEWLKTAEQAQSAPSIYGVFNLIYDGTLLADHYISKTRFKNIIKKKIKNTQPSSS